MKCELSSSPYQLFVIASEAKQSREEVSFPGLLRFARNDKN